MNAHLPLEVGADAPTALVEAVEAVAARLAVSLAVRSADGASARLAGVNLAPDAEPWRIEAAVLRGAAPRHLLFLCVANSARSQIAEGVARRLAGGSVRISSAGSEPSTVRPEAIAVLAEIGIDASGQRSKGADDVERTVDAVVTLCAEEVCPVWLGDARRLHWGLPDPAAVSGGPEERLSAFRAVRDELRTRLDVLLGPPEPVASRARVRSAPETR